MLRPKLKGLVTRLSIPYLWRVNKYTKILFMSMEEHIGRRLGSVGFGGTPDLRGIIFSLQRTVRKYSPPTIYFKIIKIETLIQLADHLH